MPLHATSTNERQSLVKVGEKQSFGSRDSDQVGLVFECPTDSKVEVSYIKVFATTEATDFWFLEQWFRSPSEDRLRELQVESKTDSGPPLDESIGRVVRFGGLASWTTAMFTIIRTSI